MDAPATSVLAYALWPLLTFTIVTLWLAAMLDISRHRRRGTFTSAGLLGMAALVSVVAVIAFAGSSAVLANRWVEAVSRAGFAGIQANTLEDEGSARAYIFSFGLENASYGSSVSSTGTKKSQNPTAPR
jgi:hypothetical protein